MASIIAMALDVTFLFRDDYDDLLTTLTGDFRCNAHQADGS